MQSPRRILLVRPSALGDVCRTVPLLATCKHAWPDAQIDWLVQQGFEDAVSAHPALHRTVPFPRHALSQDLKRARTGPLLGFLRSLRKERYDLVIDAQGLLRSGLITRATGAAARVGHRSAREFAWLCYTNREHGSEGAHTVDRMLALGRTIGLDPVRDMRLYPPAADRAAVAAEPRLAEPYAMLAPTSRWPGKQWPAERFDALAAALLDTGRIARVLVVGGQDERDQCRPLLTRAQQDPRVIDLVGDTSVGRLMALVERAALVVANDSASLHMAVGFDRPLVALFGPTRVDLVGPYQREHDVLQHVTPDDPMDHKHPTAGLALMQRITTEEVIDACRARLTKS